MSTKIGIIAEGPIDQVLLVALMSRIAADKVGITWPIRGESVAEIFSIRKRGHGGVVETVRKLVKALDTEVYDHHCFVILLDRKTEAVQKEITKLVSGKARFILGIAIEEIEAWWLGDRRNTLAWSGYTNELPAGCRYAKANYKAEDDDDPKLSLDELTRLSDKFDRCYGEGSVDLAEDFADRYWKQNAHLDEIATQCPCGYKPFQKAMVNSFRPLSNQGRRRMV